MNPIIRCVAPLRLRDKGGIFGVLMLTRAHASDSPAALRVALFGVRGPVAPKRQI
jgi:hypothetical protein